MVVRACISHTFSISEMPCDCNHTYELINIAQLYVWGMLRQSGISCVMREIIGLPDVSVYVNRSTIVAGEIKDIHTSKNPDNLAKVVLKANSQIKRFSDSAS